MLTRTRVFMRALNSFVTTANFKKAAPISGSCSFKAASPSLSRALPRYTSLSTWAVTQKTHKHRHLSLINFLCNFSHGKNLCYAKSDYRNIPPFARSLSASLFLYYRNFFYYVNTLPTASGSTAYARPIGSSGADSPWRWLCFGLDSPIPFFSFIANDKFFKSV